MSQHNRMIGKIGEDFALRHAMEKGYRCIGRNVRTPIGEIDLIFEHNGTIIFTEVKTRTGGKFGYPEEAITSKKMTRMIACAEHYLYQNELDAPWRIDVVAIMIDPDRKKNPDLQWMENVTD